jgi:hypothetical protein
MWFAHILSDLLLLGHPTLLDSAHISRFERDSVCLHKFHLIHIEMLSRDVLVVVALALLLWYWNISAFAEIILLHK